jgi:hypothetical protein
MRHPVRALLAILIVLLVGVAPGVVAQAPQPQVGQPGKDVVWVPTAEPLVDKMLDLAKVTAEDHVIDLGSGDGRTVIAAAKRGAPVGKIPVSGASGETVEAVAVDDLRVLVKRGDDKGVAVEARVPRLVQAPVRARQPLGDVVIRRGDQELGHVGVIADRDVASTGWLSWFWNRSLSATATR